jgi:hypothetical protein
VTGCGAPPLVDTLPERQFDIRKSEDAKTSSAADTIRTLFICNLLDQSRPDLDR